MSDKETLEEVAENFWLNDDSMTDNDRISYVNGFLACSKWQKERSYSEEEVYHIVEQAIKDNNSKQLHFFDGGYSNPVYTNLKKWFNKIKKK
jgi:hypothetical protein